MFRGNIRTPWILSVFRGNIHIMWILSAFRGYYPYFVDTIVIGRIVSYLSHIFFMFFKCLSGRGYSFWSHYDLFSL